MSSLAASDDVDDDAVNDDDATAVLARHGKSFRFAGVFLPADQLRDAAVVYAFCRAVDDAVDDAPSLPVARARLSSHREELAHRSPPRPHVRAFVEVCARRGVDLRFADELLEGMAFDAGGPVRVADDDELLRYCYRAAGAVGGLMCGVLGVKDRAALPFALDLGIAMQLTNICRDVLEDAGNDRVYLPRARLLAAGGSPQPQASSHPSKEQRQAVVDVVGALLSLAEGYYQSGEAGLRFIPWRSRFAILVAARVYRGIGTRLRRQGTDPLRGRVSTGLLDKLVIAAGAIGAFFFLPRAGSHDESLHTALRGLPGADVDEQSVGGQQP